MDASGASRKALNADLGPRDCCLNCYTGPAGEAAALKKLLPCKTVLKQQNFHTFVGSTARAEANEMVPSKTATTFFRLSLDIQKLVTGSIIVKKEI